MNKKILALILIVNYGMASAKKVKFSVDMTGQTISPNGVHISGDFQTEAGFPTDWDSKATPLTKENGTDIYSVEVTIPAFRKYEYKFVNGDQFYEVEFVPEKSRVAYDFSDNRWIYVDSLSSDIKNLPALLFGGNAPKGKKMIRFKLDMTFQNTNHKNGVHVASNLNGFKLNQSNMVSFDGKVFESIEYTDSSHVKYIFVNGSAYELGNLTCFNSDKNRFISLNSDTVLAEVCFNECSDCPASIPSIELNHSFCNLFPNPSNGLTYLKLNKPIGMYSISIYDLNGKLVRIFAHLFDNNFPINTADYKQGIYFITIDNGQNLNTTLKLIIH